MNLDLDNTYSQDDLSGLFLLKNSVMNRLQNFEKSTKAFVKILEIKIEKFEIFHGLLLNFSKDRHQSLIFDYDIFFYPKAKLKLNKREKKRE